MNMRARRMKQKESEELRRQKQVSAAVDVVGEYMAVAVCAPPGHRFNPYLGIASALALMSRFRRQDSALSPVYFARLHWDFLSGKNCVLPFIFALMHLRAIRSQWSKWSPL